MIEKIWKLKKFRAIDSLRIGALFSLLCILGRHVLEYECNDAILSNFPLFSIGIFTSFPMIAGSLYSNVMEEKRFGSLVYPLLVNVILWLPLRKKYHSIYGLILVEKWKTFCMVLISSILLIGNYLLFSHGAGKYFWGFMISEAYYIYLKRILKRFEKEKVVFNAEEDTVIVKHCRRFLLVSLMHIVVFISLAMEYHYQVEMEEKQLPIQEIEIPKADADTLIYDISPDGKRVLFQSTLSYFDSPGKSKYMISVYDLDQNKTEGIKSNVYTEFMQFSPINESIILSDYNAERKTELIKICELENENITKVFVFEENLFPQIQSLNFNKDATFLFNEGIPKTIWRYSDARRIVTYGDDKDAYDLAWVGEDAYILSRRYGSYRNASLWINVEVSWNEILEDGTIKRESKNEIGINMVAKINSLNYGNMFMKNINEKTLCIVVCGSDRKDIFNYKSYIDFWDVENERNLFSLTCENEVLDVVAFPEKNSFLIIEKMKNKKLRVSIWNLEKKKKEKEILLQGFKKDVKREKIKVIKQGEELVELGKFVKIWKIN